MEISSRFVGTPLKQRQTEVTWRELMNYAAAVNDSNPVYFDDERSGGIVAHPMFPVALTWRTLGQVWEYIEDGEFPLHLLAPRFTTPSTWPFTALSSPAMRSRSVAR